MHKRIFKTSRCLKFLELFHFSPVPEGLEEEKKEGTRTEEYSTTSNEPKASQDVFDVYFRNWLLVELCKDDPTASNTFILARHRIRNSWWRISRIGKGNIHSCKILCYKWFLHAEHAVVPLHCKEISHNCRLHYPHLATQMPQTLTQTFNARVSVILTTNTFLATPLCFWLSLREDFWTRITYAVSGWNHS